MIRFRKIDDIEHTFHVLRDLRGWTSGLATEVLKLCIEECICARDDIGFRQICEKLRWKLPGLEIAVEVQVSFNSLATILNSNQFITKLNLYPDWLSQRRGNPKAFGSILKSNKTLRQLDIGSNWGIDEITALELAKALKENTTLETLYLEGVEIGERGLFAIVSALKDNSTLRDLNIEINPFDERVENELVAALRANHSLLKLNLNYNGVGGEGIMKILKFNSSLKELYIAFNALNAFGGCVISEGLKENCSLEILDLGGNRIGEIGALAISEMLKVNCTLKKLILKDNIIGDIGAEAIANGIVENIGLRHLNLEFNDIRENGGSAIAKAMELNSTISTLEIGHNAIGFKNLNFIISRLRVNAQKREHRKRKLMEENHCEKRVKYI